MIFLKQNGSVGQLAIVDVFAYFDGPRLFVAENPAGQRFLVNSLDSDRTSDVWLLSAISERRLMELSEGGMDVRTAFTNPELGTVVEIQSNKEGDIISTRVLTPTEVVEENLPDNGVVITTEVTIPSPNAAFLAKSINASVVLLHLFPGQSRREAPLKKVGSIFSSLQDYLALKLNRALEISADTKELLGAYQLDLLGTFAGSLGVEIAVRGTDSRIAPALKAAVENVSIDEPEAFRDRMSAADDNEVHAVKRLMADLTKVNSDLKLETASQGDIEPVRTVVRLPRIRDAMKALKRPPKVRSEIRTVEGDLVALNLRTHKFEITTLEEEKVTGVLAGPIFTEHQTAELPSRYRVSVERDVRKSASGREEKGTWRMISATKLL